MTTILRPAPFHLAASPRVLAARAVAIAMFCTMAAAAASAKDILQESGVKGGLVVVIGCGNPTLLVDLRTNDSYLVHGLDTDSVRVAAAREHLRSRGLYGPVSVDTFDGEHLPYVDNLVNLLVAEELGDVTMVELMRVLAPLGVAHIGGKKTVKPWPEAIDEWTHYLHGPGNNAVARDTVVGQPKRYQWIAGPRWARSHDHLSSLSAMVSAGGRIFYIVDEAPIASVAFKSEWRLVARDAFSGVLLWKRDIGPWENQFRQFRTGPTALAKRLAALGDRVYVTLGYGGPISILDTATGKTIRTCGNTHNALELAVDDGVIYAVVGDRAPFEHEDTGRAAPAGEKHWKLMREKAPFKHLVAVDAATGRLLWKKDDDDTREIMPSAMAVSEKRLFIQNEKALLALDARTGKEIWRAARPVNLDSPGSSAPTLVAANGVVICSDREVAGAKQDEDSDGHSVRWHMYPHTAHSRNGEAIAYDAATGKRLWRVKSVENFRAPADVFVVDDTAYVRSDRPGLTAGLDLVSGRIKDPTKKRAGTRPPGTHWRCYRNKATERYMVLCEIRPADTAFYEFDTGLRYNSDFVRGACQFGVLPCNGLLYSPHHSCACKIESKLNSFKALAPDPNPAEDHPGARRHEKGPAFAKATAGTPAVGEGDWPTYRGDAARSGVAKTEVAAELKEAWRKTVGSRLTAPVVAGGLLVVASPDSHGVHALNAETGDPVWRFTAGSAVDSPPTIHKGMAIFGSADGWLYALRASDGVMSWRYRLAPVDRRIVAYGKVESLWPVHGSVLVLDGVVYAVAGRSTSMDGMIFYALDALTGRTLAEQRVESASFPDILSSDGESLFMRQLRLDKHGGVQPNNVPHLFSSAGFLDDTWWHRTYWQFGTGMSSGYTRWFAAGERRPAGRLMVMDQERIYGFGRLNQYNHVGSHVGLGTMQYLLYAANRSGFGATAGKAKRKPLPWNARKPDIPTTWQGSIGLLARGMVLCDKILFVAGPPDLFGTAPGKSPHAYDPAPAESLRAQREALEGRKGTVLKAVSTETGDVLAEYNLDGLPAWDGFIAANGRLYLTMQDGKILCYE